MRTLLILMAVVPLAAQPAAVRNPRTSPADIAAGAKTFRSHCSPCHGMKGEGGRGPNLASGRFYHGSTDPDLLNNISNGIDGTEMPGLFYSPDRVWQVVAYIRSLRTAAAAGLKGDSKHGAELFRADGCVRCHRVNGQGGRLGPDLTQIGEMRSPDYLRRALLDPNADVPQGYYVVNCRDSAGTKYQGFLMNEDTYTVQFMDMREQLHSLVKADLRDYKVEKVSMMPSYKDKLTGADTDDLVAFLASLRRQGVVQ